MPDISNFLLQGSWVVVIKIPVLLLMFLYCIFAFIVVSRIKALNRTVEVSAAGGTKTIQTLAIIQLLLAISLFALTLVII